MESALCSARSGRGSMVGKNITDVMRGQITSAIFGLQGANRTSSAPMWRKERRELPRFPFAERINQARVAAGYKTTADLDKALCDLMGVKPNDNGKYPQIIWAIEERAQEESTRRGQKASQYTPQLAILLRRSVEYLITGENGKPHAQPTPAKTLPDERFLAVQKAWENTTADGQNALYAVALQAPRREASKPPRKAATKSTQHAVARAATHPTKDRPASIGARNGSKRVKRKHKRNSDSQKTVTKGR